MNTKYANDIAGIFNFLTNDEPGQQRIAQPNLEHVSLAMQRWYQERFECPFDERCLRTYVEAFENGCGVRFEDATTKRQWFAPFTYPLSLEGFTAGIRATHEEIETYLSDMEVDPEEETDRRDIVTDET